jgi:hypothetical protein
MIVSVHQPQYIPWLGYFDKIAKSDCFIFLDCVQYKTREFQNRNKIRTDRGWSWLTVPVVSQGKSRQKISEVYINNELPWKRQHLNSWKSWYGRAEFFDAYFPFLEDTYGREWNRLIDINVHIIMYILKQLAIPTKIYFESAFDVQAIKTERIIELCKKIKATTYLSGAGGKAYLEEERFYKEGIALAYQHFNHPVYPQLFQTHDSDFIPYLSVWDLLFNVGNRSRTVLTAEDEDLLRPQ